MSNNSIQELKEYCNKNRIAPEYQTVEQEHFGYLTTITVQVGTESKPIVVSALGQTEEEARSSAAKEFLTINKDKTYEELVESTKQLASDGHNRPVKTQNTLKSVNTMASNASAVGNTIGFLIEMCTKKGYPHPTYEQINQSGADHQLVFTFRCFLNAGGQALVGEGKGSSKKEAKKLSAEEVLRQLNELSVSSAVVQKPINDQKTDIKTYLMKCFNECMSELNECFTEENSDYCKKLEKIASLLGCRLKYDQSLDANQVFLQLVVPELNYTLITSFGSSKQIAAKKAVLMLKILNTNDQNI